MTSLIFLGLLSGFFSGLLGIGGAVILVPGLVLIAGYQQQLAQGTALWIIIPTALVGALLYSKQISIDWKIALILSALAMIGSFAGSRLALSLPPPLLRRIFACVMILVGIKLFIK